MVGLVGRHPSSPSMFHHQPGGREPGTLRSLLADVDFHGGFLSFAADLRSWCATISRKHARDIAASRRIRGERQNERHARDMDFPWK